jgi:hypothetical protein
MTLDENFEGALTEKAFNRASSIATVIQTKLIDKSNTFFS